jgi:hypothetical protein
MLFKVAVKFISSSPYLPFDLGPPPLSPEAPPLTEAEAVLNPPVFEKVLF